MKLINPTGQKNIQIQAGESLKIQLEDFASGSRDFNLTVELIGENAECHISGRAQSRAQDKKSWQVKQIFKGKEQIGSIDLRGTAEDQSFLTFDGAANLTNSSRDAEADIQEHIILFDQAKGRSMPILRVETDQVKAASHGASIAPVNQERVLYLQSRGISTEAAETILKEGFLA